MFQVRKGNTAQRTSVVALLLVIGGFSLFSISHHSQSQSVTGTSLERRQSSGTFPQIYAADGILNCGSPLQPDQCTLAPPSAVSLSTTEQAFSIHIASLFEWSIDAQATSLIPYFGPTLTFSFDTTATFNATWQISVPATPLFTRISATNSYSPVISPTSPSIASATTTSGPKPTKVVRRSTYQYNICDGEAPSHNFVTRSLTEVCQFVANASQWFVSLRPSGASAYLPCWPGYLVQTLISIIDLLAINEAFFAPAGIKKVPTSSMTLSAIGSVIGVARTAFALMSIIIQAKSGQGWDSLPFINPVLWLDWAAIYSFSGHIWPGLSLLSAIIGIGMYGVSFWLCVGYANRGYGTVQYDVLDVPTLCQAATAYNTDPRRRAFLALHLTYFITANVAAFFLLIAITERSNSSKTKGQVGPMDPCLKKTMALLLVIPAFYGFIVSAVLHGYPYLILLKDGCYASYVSGRFGFLDLPSVSWMIKVAIMLGINI